MAEGERQLDERKKIAAKIQERAFEVVPYIPTGQWTPKTAYRKNLKGVIEAPGLLHVECREDLNRRRFPQTTGGSGWLTG